MTQTETGAEDGVTTFLAHAEVQVNATPREVYDVVSDLKRSGEWSPECTGGEWVTGEPGQVGSVFRGDNERGEEVLPWAPVVRGPWQTYAEVIEAVPGTAFRWSILNSRRGRQESVWSFEIAPAPGGGSTLVHRFRMGRPTEGMGTFLDGLDDEARARFLREWNAKLGVDVEASVNAVKKVIEAGVRA